MISGSDEFSTARVYESQYAFEIYILSIFIMNEQFNKNINMF